MRIRRNDLGLGMVVRVAAAIVVVGAIMAATAAPDAGAVPIHEFWNKVTNTQAGGHPNVVTFFSLGARNDGTPTPPCDCDDAKDVIVHSPAGLIGDPHAAPQCSDAAFANNECPVDSQVGVVNHLRAGGFELGDTPIFNLDPHPGEAGLVGYEVPIDNGPLYESINSRTGSDYGLDFEISEITHIVPLEEVEQTLWGVPAESANDPERYPQGWNSTWGYGFNFAEPPTASNSPLTPYIQNPTTCGVPLTSRLNIIGYDDSTTEAVSPFPGTTNCGQLSFNPSLSAQPTTTDGDSPSGLEVNLSVPQLQSPTVPSPSEIRAAKVILPSGFSINPNAADGKTSCSDAEAMFGTEEEAHCPENSKIGSLSIESSALPGPLPGYVYIGEPQEGDRYRIFLTANGFNTHVKLAGSVEPNPETGQLTVSFPNLPETPFSDFNLHIFGSERGLLSTPTRCGSYPVESSFTPWDSALPQQSSTQFFTVDSGPGGSPCPSATRPFGPTFEAASANDAPGAHSPFSIELNRPDGQQDLSSLRVTTPPGLLATLRGVSYCPDASLSAAAELGHSGLMEQVAPICPAASQIGTSTTGAGAGNHPVYLSGKVYLAGPYKGAPLSLAVITPAVSGPYDLGNVVVRAALNVDPNTTQITAASDPLPQILEGIPLRLRSIRIDLNRQGFTLNPTNCDPFAVTANASGEEGTTVALSEHFQVVNCSVLSFSPKLALSFSGNTNRAANPAVKAVLTFPTGGAEANVSSTAVALPRAESIDNAHIRSPCTKVQFNANNCPAASVIGFAEAETPLLEKPLEGPVYFRSAPENKSGLPDIVAALKGQIDVDLDGKIKTIHQKLPNGETAARIRTTFGGIPDAPVSKFILSLKGGAKGLLQNNTNICRAPRRLIVQMVGQNGKATEASPALGLPCSHSKGRHSRASKRPTNGNERKRR